MVEEYKKYNELQEQFDETKTFYSKELQDILIKKKKALQDIKKEYSLKLTQAN